MVKREFQKGEGDTPEGQLYESNLGSPTEQQIAQVCNKIWGNSKNNDKLKVEFKSILVPKNCSFMKTS